jgi:hypothetical protein
MAAISSQTVRRRGGADPAQRDPQSRRHRVEGNCRFDRWLRTFAPTSRRAAVGGIASSVLALLGDDAPAGAAKCRKLSQDCSGSTPCCKTVLFNLRCKNGKCRCKTGFKDCNQLSGTCETNIRTDPDDCGQCGIECANGESCINGTCTCANGFGGCPDGCGTCSSRNQGGAPICRAGVDLESSCETDAECPIGAACVTDGFCSIPCFA